MLKRVDFIEPSASFKLGSTLILSLGIFPGEGVPSYKITEIDGIEPLPASLNLVDDASPYGRDYRGFTIAERTLVFKIQYFPDYSKGETIESLRNGLYDIFQPGRMMTMAFYKEMKYFITGYVDKVIPSIFTDKPEITISLICPEDPFFSAEFEKAINITTSTPNNFRPYLGNAPTPYYVTISSLPQGTDNIAVSCGERVLYRWNGSKTTTAGSFILNSGFTRRGFGSVAIVGKNPYDGTTEGSLVDMIFPADAHNFKVTISGGTTTSTACNVKFFQKYQGI